MLTVATLLLLAAPAAGETVLLDFYSESCGPCRMMEPTLARLQAQGHPVRKIDVSQHPQYARQMGVDAVPCFVMLAEGREIDRVVGYTSFDRLSQMLEQGRRIAAQAPPAAGGSSLPSGTRPTSFGVGQPAAASRELEAGGAWRHQPEVANASFERPAELDRSRLLSAEDRALAATVRLKIEDTDGHSFGTGTIVHQHRGEALVLTCGHVFRDSRGQGRITVDLFRDGNHETLAGELISYDLQLDVGLVSMRTNSEITTAELAVSSFRPAVDEAVFSIGCDHGRAPTVIASRVAAVNKYVGPENVVVRGAPVDGRSGGGLFSADGKLIGVCNAADPADNEGLYAAIATIHQHLEKERLAHIFQRRGAADMKFAGGEAGVGVMRGQSETEERTAPPDFRLPGERGTEVQQVVCIVQREDGGEERIVIDRPTPELLTRLRGEHSPNANERGGVAGSGGLGRPTARRESRSRGRGWDDVVIPQSQP